MHIKTFFSTFLCHKSSLGHSFQRTFPVFKDTENTIISILNITSSIKRCSISSKENLFACIELSRKQKETKKMIYSFTTSHLLTFNYQKTEKNHDLSTRKPYILILDQMLSSLLDFGLSN